MKTKLILTLLILIYACNTANDGVKKPIIDVLNSSLFNDEINKHKNKDKDVMFYKKLFPENELVFMYKISMYRKVNSEVKEYITLIQTNDDYMNASYNWINDSTMKFKMFNTSKVSSKEYTMIGSGDSSSLE